jgi:RNA recognition motif-containing protein
VAVSADSKTLWIGDIESWMDENYIEQSFTFARPTSIKIIKDKTTGLPTGYGFMEFPSHDVAQQILASFNGKPVPGTNKSFRLKWGFYGPKISSGPPLQAPKTSTLPTHSQSSVQ